MFTINSHKHTTFQTIEHNGYFFKSNDCMNGDSVDNDIVFIRLTIEE